MIGDGGKNGNGTEQAKTRIMAPRWIVIEAFENAAPASQMVRGERGGYYEAIAPQSPRTTLSVVK